MAKKNNTEMNVENTVVLDDDPVLKTTDNKKTYNNSGNRTNGGYKKPAFWRVFDPRQESQLTRSVRVSPILDSEGVQVKFDVTLEGEDEYRTRHFPYEDGELYRAAFQGPDSFPYIQQYKLPDSLEDRLVLVLGFSRKLKDSNIPKGALKYNLAEGISFYFDPQVNDKGQLHLKPVSYTISTKEIGKVGAEVLAWIEKRGSLFPDWYVRAKLPEIF